MPRRSSVTGSSSMLRPSMRISPESNGMSLLTILSAVVLPPPDGPTSTQNVPAGISSDRSSTAAASRPTYRFVTWSKTISAALFAPAPAKPVPSRACEPPSSLRLMPHLQRWPGIPDPEQPNRSTGGDQGGGDPHRKPKAGLVERVRRAGDGRADDGDAQQAGDASDGVVDAARDSRIALVRVREHGRRQRGDDHRHAHREHEERGQELPPVREAGFQP